MMHFHEKSIICHAARRFAFDKHAGQYDKADRPYSEHLEYVARHVPQHCQVVAWLHDVVEDTDATIEDIASLFGEQVAHSVDCLTKRKGEQYDDYLIRVASDATAVEVKIADLRHNMDLNRLPHVTIKDVERVRKYATALRFLMLCKEGAERT